MSEDTWKHTGEPVWCRERLAQWCKGNILDAGFGGSPILPNAICMDRELGHPARARVPEPVPPTHYVGDVRDLPFKDQTLDTVFSSHVLEDFENTREVLQEWIRVLKIGGHLVLFLPDQARYVQHCEARCEPPNSAHKLPQFSLEWVKECAKGLGVVVVHELNEVPGNCYSFDVVFKKIA